MFTIVKLLFSNYDIAWKNKAHIATLFMILNLIIKLYFLCFYWLMYNTYYRHHTKRWPMTKQILLTPPRIWLRENFSCKKRWWRFFVWILSNNKTLLSLLLFPPPKLFLRLIHLLRLVLPPHFELKIRPPETWLGMLVQCLGCSQQTSFFGNNEASWIFLNQLWNIYGSYSIHNLKSHINYF